MLPEEAHAQVQWWHQLRPAFEGALRLWQYDEDDIIRVQQVALKQVERLAPHLPPAEIISMCKVRLHVHGQGHVGPGLVVMSWLCCDGQICLPSWVLCA